ncbi:flagellar biosynthetic protein FliR [Aureliella helgolandensis]|uniref:Flagellar biosynthesis protein FliR n=1 Tax=Aureliella helgolandensis TaxID=2527968 RepID=A0A518GGK4_9BACT|nr:flagellar biosynthetic protein FliR [Aureliella helgolandensis]QDV27731.1 flagellar biosynthesis protein FliR [Aureliella helgolandensis]
MGDMLLSVLSQPLWIFISVLARISPPLMMAPPTRSSAVPVRVRGLIAVSAAALVTPVALSGAQPMPGDILNIALSLVGELLLGGVLGSILLLAITSLQIAGQAIGNLAGFDLATSIDPSSDEEMPVISNMLGWLAMVILLLMGGHRELMECCLESFTRYPVGSVVFEARWLEEFDSVLRHTFVIGIRAAAPLATALLLSNLITGLLARTLPQLNVLAIGFNINAMALLMLLFLAVGGVSWVYQTELSVWIDSCHRIVASSPS